MSDQLYHDYFSHTVLPFINGKFREIYDKGVEENPDTEHMSWEQFKEHIDQKAIQSFRYNFMNLITKEWHKGMVVKCTGYGKHAFKYWDYPSK